MIDDFEMLLGKLAEAHDQWPSLRFGQLIESILPKNNPSMYYITDDTMIESIETYMENNQ